jgi:serine protease Do
MKKVLFLIKRKLLKLFLPKIILVGFLSSLFSILIIFGTLYFFRFDLLNFLANNLPKEENKEVVDNFVLNQNIKELNEEEGLLLNKTEEIKIKEESREDIIVSTVKKAKPAVVSILLLKEVPKYDITYKYENTIDGNGDIVPNLYQKKEIKTQAGTEYKQIGSGSGFLINKNGLIITNKHVINKEGVVFKVLLNDGTEYTPEIIAIDSILDIAFIKINSNNLPYLTLADSNKIDVGQSVIAIGNALGEFKNTVSFGIISGLSRSVVAEDKYGLSERLDEVIQTDAAINSGNSGGPLIDLNGQVVGINVAKVEDSSNIGFALPINSVKDIISSVEKTGKIIRPYVGIRYIPINDLIKNKYNLNVSYGILIKKGKDETEPAVLLNSPAEKSGIKEGDIILEVEGVKIDSSNDFSYLIRNKKIGQTVYLKILSLGVEKFIGVKLEQAPEGW